MRTRISKAYRGSEHVGWKKLIGNQSWFLGYGITAAAEMKASALAEVLEAKWRLIKASGGTELLQTDVDEARELLEGRPRWASARQNVAANELAVTPAIVLPATAMPTSIAVPAAHSGHSSTSAPRWLYASIDEFVLNVRRSLKSDMSNGDYVHNLMSNIDRARQGIGDLPLEALRRKELDDWLLAIRSFQSKLTGHPT